MNYECAIWWENASQSLINDFEAVDECGATEGVIAQKTLR